MTIKKRGSLDTVEERASFISDMETGIWETESPNGEKSLIYITRNESMDIETYQEDGCIRNDRFDRCGVLINSRKVGIWSENKEWIKYETK